MFIPTVRGSDGSLTLNVTGPATAYSGGIGYVGSTAIFATTTTAASDIRMGGMRVSSGGALVVNDATAGLPAGALTIGGMAFGSDGSLCVTKDAVSGATYISGIAVKSDGRVFSTGLP